VPLPHHARGILIAVKYGDSFTYRTAGFVLSPQLASISRADFWLTAATNRSQYRYLKNIGFGVLIRNGHFGLLFFFLSFSLELF
jgi:hypothetical protein